MKNKSNKRYLAVIALFSIAIFQTGCAMCCGTYDYAYAGHGGKWQRSDLVHGRVASPFSDPNARMARGMAVESVEDTDLEVIE